MTARKIAEEYAKEGSARDLEVMILRYSEEKSSAAQLKIVEAYEAYINAEKSEMLEAEGEFIALCRQVKPGFKG